MPLTHLCQPPRVGRAWGTYALAPGGRCRSSASSHCSSRARSSSCGCKRFSPPLFLPAADGRARDQDFALAEQVRVDALRDLAARALRCDRRRCVSCPPFSLPRAARRGERDLQLTRAPQSCRSRSRSRSSATPTSPSPPFVSSLPFSSALCAASSRCADRDIPLDRRLHLLDHRHLRAPAPRAPHC